MTQVRIRFVEDIGDIAAKSRPGCAEYFISDRSPRPDKVAGLLFICPCGCGVLGALNFGPLDEHPFWMWDGNRSRPTLSPSIQKTSPCKWHGYLTAGVFHEHDETAKPWESFMDDTRTNQEAQETLAEALDPAIAAGQQPEPSGDVAADSILGAEPEPQSAAPKPQPESEPEPLPQVRPPHRGEMVYYRGTRNELHNGTRDHQGVVTRVWNLGHINLLVMADCCQPYPMTSVMHKTDWDASKAANAEWDGDAFGYWFYPHEDGE